MTQPLLSAPDDCPHESLTIEMSLYTLAERLVRCEMCGKTIAIPDLTLVTGSRTAMQDIVALVFGPQWKERLGKHLQPLDDSTK